MKKAFPYGGCGGHVLSAALLVGSLGCCDSVPTAAVAVRQAQDVLHRKFVPKITRTFREPEVSVKPQAQRGHLVVNHGGENGCSGHTASKTDSLHNPCHNVMTGWIPGVSAGWLRRSWAQRAAQALRSPGRGATVWAAAVTGLAAVRGGGGAVGVVDRVRLGHISARPVG